MPFSFWSMIPSLARSRSSLIFASNSSGVICNKRLTSLLTNLAYWPPHQPPYQPSPTLLTSLHQPHLPASTNLAYQPSHQPLPLANSRWDARLRIMYIYGTYIPPLERASLSLILSSSHQAQ